MSKFAIIRSQFASDNFHDNLSFCSSPWTGSSVIPKYPYVFYPSFNCCYDPYFVSRTKGKSLSWSQAVKQYANRMEMNGTLFASRSNYRRSSAHSTTRWTPSKQYLRDRKFRRRMGNDVRRCALAGSLATSCFRNGTKQLPRPFHTSCIVQLKVHFALSCQMPSRSNRVPFLSGSCYGGWLARCGSQTFDIKSRKRSRVECKRPTAGSEIFLIEVRHTG